MKTTLENKDDRPTLNAIHRLPTDPSTAKTIQRMPFSLLFYLLSSPRLRLVPAIRMKRHRICKLSVV